jgi:hypothetical protein
LAELLAWKAALAAVAALDAILVFADEAQEALLKGALVVRVPGDGEADVGGPWNDR